MSKKPNITNVTSGFSSTIALNNNFTSLSDGFNNTLSLDGSTPNAMQTELDLANNNIINVGSVETDTLLLGGVLMTPSGVDPVYSGTISSFGASLIDDADAAAGRATLGIPTLSTVAATGSYTDLSNQPSLNFASSAQGTLADSSVQPTDIQAESAWTTGTSTTESIVSPAKVKESVLAHNPIKAFVNFDGTNATIRKQSNIASVVRNSTGVYTLTFTTAMSDANYIIHGTTRGVSSSHPATAVSISYTTAPTTTSFDITVGETGGANSVGRFRDIDIVNITIIS